MRLRRAVAGAWVTLALALTACGDSDQGAVEERISRERAEAAQQAKQKAEIDRLKDELDDVKRGDGRTTTVVREGGSSSSGMRGNGGSSSGTALRVFHSPGGRVNCAIFSDGADCSVASIGSTFVLRRGSGPARLESGLRLSAGSGSTVGWDQSVTAGTITCVVPPQSAPRGIACNDSATGHGFEASKVPSRQKTF